MYNCCGSGTDRSDGTRNRHGCTVLAPIATQRATIYPVTREPRAVVHTHRVPWGAGDGGWAGCTPSSAGGGALSSIVGGLTPSAGVAGEIGGGGTGGGGGGDDGGGAATAVAAGVRPGVSARAIGSPSATCHGRQWQLLHHILRPSSSRSCTSPVPPRTRRSAKAVPSRTSTRLATQ